MKKLTLICTVVIGVVLSQTLRRNMEKNESEFLMKLETLGAKPEEIQLLESKLGLPLPANYKIALSKDIRQGLPLYGHYGEESAFITDVNGIIYLYQYFAEEDFHGKVWPKTIIPIGTDGGGGHYFIDVKDKQDIVYYVDLIEEDLILAEKKFDLSDYAFAYGFNDYRKKLYEIEIDVAREIR